MENEKKVSFQLLVLIATPKLADRAAEMFRKGALPLQYRFHAEGTATSECAAAPENRISGYLSH